MEDIGLIEKARRGDEAAWEQIVRSHQEAVFRLAYLYTRDEADAADVAQETFIRAYKALERFDATRALKPWLLSIVANQARNRRRSIGRYWAALQRWQQGRGEEFKDVEKVAEAQSKANRLWQAVQRLGEGDQQVIYLRYFLELPVAEAAEVLKVAEGTIKSRTSRALRRLETIIENDFPDLKQGSLDAD
ncbi:MAG: sigma-70 family RNA polymerase sigma factor [Chloroflexi bacterium]|nr:MAG: sigma-70 family RNA polymerase sigma factor [Chloroflexota bacterium]MBL1193664.1 sigma-70 family RNA polymerase sigma factor [Chloroflexota bacterium]NOH10956.1 sigma-70 family RNA polymerase sigma factor [Chloroflexota bacterium]